jgi:hypothetical protein
MIQLSRAARRATAGAAVSFLLLAACSDDSDSTTSTSATSVSTTAPTTVAPSTTVPPTTTAAPTTSAASTSVAPTTAAPTTTVVGLEQPAIWPAADVVFTTPEEAAADFVVQVLGVPPSLGEFVQGDSRSGEIEVMSPGEGGGTPSPRAVLFLRQLGPASSWFVIGAGSDGASITTPETLDEVPADLVTVEGVARGFEASMMVSAYIAGNPEVLTQQHTMAGTMEEAGPFSVQLDLSGAQPGDVVMLMVRGGVGLEADPGEFSAIPVVIADDSGS